MGTTDAPAPPGLTFAGRIELDGDYCPVPAASICATLGEAGMAAVTLAEADLARMPSRQVYALLADLTAEADPQVAEAAAAAQELLCSPHRTCTCTDDTVDAFLSELGTQLAAFATREDIVTRAWADSTGSDRVPGWGLPALEDLAEEHGLGDWDAVRVRLDDTAGTGALTFRDGGAWRSLTLTRLRGDRATAWAQWVAYTTNAYDGPDPFATLVTMDEELFRLLQAMTESRVDIRRHLPADFPLEDEDEVRGYPACWMALRSTGLLDAGKEQQRLLAAVAPGFVGTLDELVASVAAAQLEPAP